METDIKVHLQQLCWLISQSNPSLAACAAPQQLYAGIKYTLVDTVRQSSNTLCLRAYHCQAFFFSFFKNKEIHFQPSCRWFSPPSLSSRKLFVSQTSDLAPNGLGAGSVLKPRGFVRLRLLKQALQFFGSVSRPVEDGTIFPSEDCPRWDNKWFFISQTPFVFFFVCTKLKRFPRPSSVLDFGDCQCACQCLNISLFTRQTQCLQALCQAPRTILRGNTLTVLLFLAAVGCSPLVLGP